MEKSALTNLGLTEGESKVYLALLKSGSSTVGPIVKEAKVAYSNIYEILDRLLEKGLVSFIIKEKTRYYQAVQPSRLKDYIDKKEEELQKEKQTLKQLIPELEKIQNPKSNQEAEIFLGFKGIKTAYERMLQEKGDKEWLFFYFSQKDYNQEADEFFTKSYSLFKNLNLKGISSPDYKNSAFVKKTRLKIKYVSFPIPGNIDIHQDKVLLTSWQQPLAILITSKDIANKFKAYFYSIWNQKT